MEALGLDRLTGPMTKAEYIAKLHEAAPRLGTTVSGKFGSDDVNVPGGRSPLMTAITWDNPTDHWRDNPYTHTAHGLPKNTLLHHRTKVDSYVDENGKKVKVLRGEELQSDMSQELKSEWQKISSPDRIETINIPLAEIEDHITNGKYAKMTGREKENIKSFADTLRKQAAAQSALDNIAGKPPITYYQGYRVKDSGDKRWVPLAANGKLTPQDIYNEHAAAFGDELVNNGVAAQPLTEIERMMYNEKHGKPPAPYVTEGSKTWVPLAVKSLIKEGIDRGVDEIALMPGSVHEERWRFNSRNPEGLRDFYDNVVPKAAQKVVDDLTKESGIQGIKVEKQKRPFLGPMTMNARHQKPSHWLDNAREDEYMNALRVNDPSSAYDLRKHISRLMSRLESRYNVSVPTKEHFDMESDRIHNSMETSEKYLASSQDIMDKLESIPYDQLTRLEREQWNTLNSHRQSSRDNLDNSAYDLTILKKGQDFLDTWKKHHYTPPTEIHDAPWVIKLPQELKEWIEKNGMSKFAKGGIVTLNPAAYA